MSILKGLKGHFWGSEVVRRVKALTAKPDDLSSTLGSPQDWWKQRTDSWWLFFDLHVCCGNISTHEGEKKGQGTGKGLRERDGRGRAHMRI